MARTKKANNKKISVYDEVVNHIYNYKTEYEKGLNSDEMRDVYLFFESKYKMNIEKYYDALMGNTCIIVNGRILTFHCDVVKALVCAIENRDMYGYEFD